MRTPIGGGKLILEYLMEISGKEGKILFECDEETGVMIYPPNSDTPKLFVIPRMYIHQMSEQYLQHLLDYLKQP